MGETEFVILVTEEDVTAELLVCVEECVEGWFMDRPLITEDFIDRLCTSYGNDWDIENLGSPAARKVMRHARTHKKEASI
jgi:hypothetical protein